GRQPRCRRIRHAVLGTPTRAPSRLAKSRTPAMRRLALLTAAAFMIVTPFAAHAQYGGGGGGGAGRGGDDQRKQADDDAKKKKRDKEWGNSSAPLPAMRNA